MRRAARRDVIGSPLSKTEGHGFPRAVRLVRRGEFDAVYRTGKRKSNSHFTVFFRANQMPYSRFGFSIKKEIGGAVVRNRIRRRVREIVRLHREEIEAGWDLVIHPKKVVVRSEFGVVTSEFLRVVKSGMA